MGQRLRVAFVVCPSFHGATLLALLLNNHSRVSALGDTLPHRGAGHICACGELVDECSFWQTVSAGLDASRFANLPRLLPILPWPLGRRLVEGSVVHLSGSSRVNRAAGRVAGKLVDVGAPAVWRVRPTLVSDFTAVCRSFYRFVLDMHGTSLFVDGKKNSRRAALLARELQPTADVRIVHLVRDPRGFASSYRAHVGASLRESAWLWSELHRRMESLRELAPYSRLRYEDLCSDPDTELRRLFDFLRLAPEPVVTPPKYPEKHHLTGNNMLRRFDGRIELDTRWQAELNLSEQRTVLDCAGEFAKRMGYEETASPVA
jgi:Sulfotransferase family